MWCSYHDSFTGNSRDIDSRAVTPDKRLCIHRQDVYIPGKKEHSKQKFRFFPFKYFGTSDLYCLGEYLRAHRKLTCDIYRLNSACSIYWTWKSCRNKLQHGKWTEEDGRHQFHFRWIMKKFMRLTVNLIDLRGNQQMNSLNAQFITGHKGAALHDKSTLWFISKAKWWHWTGNTNVTGYQLGMRPSDHIIFFLVKNAPKWRTSWAANLSLCIVAVVQNWEPEEDKQIKKLSLFALNCVIYVKSHVSIKRNVRVSPPSRTRKTFSVWRSHRWRPELLLMKIDC